MKKIFFLFAMFASVAASATVTVTPINTEYSTQKVTFKVEWTNSPAAPYNNRIWIWIDFCPVSGVTPGGFAPATVTGATITSGSGSISGLTGRGFFITGSTTNSGTTVTATLNPIPAAQFNWCVYGSDYPPNVTFDKGTYTFKGTTNFIVSNPAQTITSKTVAKTNLTATSSTTFTDATGCPGIGSLYCPYTGSDLYMDATHLCQQRASGAKNWEAWIKDVRDNELYRIVYMPDTKWWLAQNLKYAGVGTPSVGCTPDECGRGYTLANILGGSSTGGNIQGICPAGWLLPVNSNWSALMNSIGDELTAVKAIRIPTSLCGESPNSFGFADIKGVCYTPEPVGIATDNLSQWYSWNGSSHNLIQLLTNAQCCNCCHTNYSFYDYHINNRYPKVRCMRQL